MGEPVDVVPAPEGKPAGNYIKVWIKRDDGMLLFVECTNIHPLNYVERELDPNVFVQVGSLRLSEPNAQLYRARLTKLEQSKQYWIALKDEREARRFRREISWLYDSFKKYHVPEPISIAQQRAIAEQRLSIDERVGRIERTLKIGLWEEQ
jgi:hypothetical protein